MDDRKPLIVSIRGDDIDLLKKYAAQLKEKIRSIKGIVDLDVTLEHDIPEYRLTVDRERAVDTRVDDRQYRTHRRGPGGGQGRVHL